MNEGGRPRRRLNAPTGPRRTGPKTDPWVLTIIAAIVVVVGGWFLGQGLAHVFSPKSDQAAPAQTQSPIAAATAAPSPSALPSVAPQVTPAVSKHAKPAPKTTHNPVRKVAAVPSATASAQPSAAPSAAPTTVPTAIATPSPKPQPKATPKPAERTAAPAPVRTMAPSEDIASSTVRSYIGALKRGDPQGAAALLGNGEPDEAFIDADTRITGLASTRNSDGSYKVGVSMQTAKGSYYETFLVAPSGTSARILEKTASKNP